MATTYLSAAAAGGNNNNNNNNNPSNSDQGPEGPSESGMHLAQGYHHPGSPKSSSAVSEMHEMKYLPPQHHQSPLHNGHPLAAHNPWVGMGVGMGLGHEASPWAMHHTMATAHGLYSHSQDLKQDIKPHSPADFQNPMRTHVPGMGAAVHQAASSWNPPPVSSPYLSMANSAAAAGAAASASSGGGGNNGSATPNSPSPLHQHPAYGGMNGQMLIPGQMPPHPFVDRYRESHNSSPRSSGTVDEDGMHTPTSGKYQIPVN